MRSVFHSVNYFMYRRYASQIPKGIYCIEKASLETREAFFMEQAMGVEPTSEAWEASILPINYACIFAIV